MLPLRAKMMPRMIDYVCLISMQFYTFLETSLVTLSLLPHFIAFFSDREIPGTPGTLATTFLAFGKNPLGYFLINFVYALSMRLIRSELIFSLEPGFRIECHGIPDHAYIVGLWKHDNY